jgi:hypothetical protein
MLQKQGFDISNGSDKLERKITPPTNGIGIVDAQGLILPRDALYSTTMSGCLLYGPEHQSPGPNCDHLICTLVMWQLPQRAYPQLGHATLLYAMEGYPQQHCYHWSKRCAVSSHAFTYTLPNIGMLLLSCLVKVSVMLSFTKNEVL